MAQIDFGGTMEEVVTRRRVPPAEGAAGAEERDRRRPGLRRAGPRAGAQHAGQRAPRDHRPAQGRARTGTGRSRTAGCRARRSSRSRRPPSGRPSSSTCSPTRARRPCGRRSRRCLKAGKALYFSHGFSIVYKDQTGVIPPKNIDVILVAPKGSGRTVRTQFPGRQRHQRQLRHPPGRHRQGPRTVHWPSASPSAPATSSRPPSKRRSTAT